MAIDDSAIEKELEGKTTIPKSRFKKVSSKIVKGIGKDFSQIGKGAGRIAQKVRIPLPKGRMIQSKIRKPSIKSPLLTKYGDITANVFFRRKNGSNR